MAALPEGEPGTRVGVRSRRHPRRRHGRRVGAERVLGPIPAVAVRVPHLRRGLVPRAGEGAPGGGREGHAPAEAGRRPAPRVRPAADEAAAGLVAVGSKAVVIVADFAVFQFPFFLRGEPATIQRRLRRRGRRLRGRHDAQASGLGGAEPPGRFRFLRAAGWSRTQRGVPCAPPRAHGLSRDLP